MKNIRVLLVSSKYPPEYSGSGHRAHKTYQRLNQKYGIEFDVLCSSLTENNSVCYDQDGVTVTRISRKCLPVRRSEMRRRTLTEKIGLRINYVLEAIAVARFFARNRDRYDAVHVFGNVAVTSMIISLCNRSAKPLIVEFCNEVHTPFPYRPLIFKWLFQEEFHEKARLVCISRRLEEMCRRNGLKNPIWTRPNPVDHKRFFVERNRKNFYREKRMRFKPGDIVLANVSNFIPRKNQVFLLDVMVRLPEEYKLFLAGPVVPSGPNRRDDLGCLSQIREKVQRLGLEDRVQIEAGYVDAIEEVMKAADVYVFPTKAEGLGTPMLESLCCGVSVVATRIEGITDQWILDGRNGFLSDLEAQEFARSVLAAVKIPTPELDAAAAETSRISSADVIDKKYYEILREIVPGGG